MLTYLVRWIRCNWNAEGSLRPVATKAEIFGFDDAFHLATWVTRFDSIIGFALPINVDLRKKDKYIRSVTCTF